MPSREARSAGDGASADRWGRASENPAGAISTPFIRKSSARPPRRRLNPTSSLLQARRRAAHCRQPPMRRARSCKGVHLAAGRPAAGQLLGQGLRCGADPAPPSQQAATGGWQSWSETGAPGLASDRAGTPSPRVVGGGAGHGQPPPPHQLAQTSKAPAGHQQQHPAPLPKAAWASAALGGSLGT